MHHAKSSKLGGGQSLIAILCLNGCVQNKWAKLSSLQVIVGDNEGSLRRIVQINLTEPVVNRPPQFAQEQYRFSIPENISDATEIGSLSITDEGLWVGDCFLVKSVCTWSSEIFSIYYVLLRW